MNTTLPDRSELPVLDCWEIGAGRVLTQVCPGCGTPHIHAVPEPGREHRGAHCPFYPKPPAVRDGYRLALQAGRPPREVLAALRRSPRRTPDTMAALQAVGIPA